MLIALALYPPTEPKACGKIYHKRCYTTKQSMIPAEIAICAEPWSMLITDSREYLRQHIILLARIELASDVVEERVSFRFDYIAGSPNLISCV